MTEKEYENQEYKDFLRLIVEYKSRIYGYILRLVPNRTVADDLMQETTLVMWEKFHTFTPGTNFYAWSVRIAKIKVLHYRQSLKRSPLRFTEDVFESLASVSEQETGSTENLRMQALENCLRRLSRRDHKLIRLRYTDRQKIKTIADNLGWSAAATYKLMAKIHYTLKECIERRLSTGGVR